MPARRRFLLAVLLCALASAARADEIEVQRVALLPVEEGLALDADFAFEMNPRLAEAVANGVPLYFVVEFELVRTRWWWFAEKVAARRMQLRLSYHALSRQYRLSSGLLQQSYASLGEALAVLKRVRHWIVVERAVALAEGHYEAAVRMRLDTSLLPKPFQLSALTSRELNLESAWKRFPFRYGGPAPAPVEAREPREAEAR
ncbi:MAG: DUF4390 domain-containing protein [Burkholderiales bacterium]|nr:DUF4390 domain-containing protein [Burkholderiales bacterium]